jgi:enterochelin esterase-like enzyme
MSWGVATRTAVGLSLGGIVSFVAGYASDIIFGNLETEAGQNLVQEDGGLLLLE